MALAGVASLAVVIAGFFVLLRDQWLPGAAGSAQSRWPDAAPIELDRERPTLLLFAHPQCPCTRATVGELDRIAARCRDRARMIVFFLSEPELGDPWTQTDLWTRASRIPGVEVRADIHGAIARRFGVRTSGHVLLYTRHGGLVFEGGITDSRGHAGDNPGEEFVVNGILDGATELVSMPVYGCSLGLDLEAPAEGATP